MRTVGVIGGGQLARMMSQAATALGVRLRVLVEADDSSAAQAVPESTVGSPGSRDDVLALITPAVGERADALTFEHEHIPAEVLAAARRTAVPLHPSPDALLHAQDKVVMRERLTSLGVPCPRWCSLPDAEALDRFLAAVGGRAVVKTARGGYDGKGVRFVNSAAEVGDWFDQAEAGGPALLAEESVPFTRELAVLLARNPSGQIAVWPVVETVQSGGVCSEVIAPAPDLDPGTRDAAIDAARRIAIGLDVTGVLAVELFEVPDPAGGPAGVLVNELAMRPHNSGHWTIDGAVTSQFEQHLRAVLDLPLGDTSPVARWSVMANVLGSVRSDLADALDDVLADPGVRVHLYGKQIRPGRKLGHVTVCGDDLADARVRAARAAGQLRGDND